MNIILLLIPFSTALACWFIAWLLIRFIFRPYQQKKIVGFTIQGILPAIQNDAAEALGAYAENELMDPAFLKEKIASPEILQKAMPVIEKHIDEFLHKKLKESLPVISMFIGERVLNQLKDLFVKELEKLFPVVMSGFVDDAAKSIDIKTEISKRVSTLDIQEIEKQFYQKQGSQINKLKWAAFLFGLLVGIIQLAIVYFSY